MSAIQALVAVLLGYMFGCLQTSYLISKIVLKKDIREIGFGNAGASNITSEMGWGFGFLTGVTDVLKAYIPVQLIVILFPEAYQQIDLKVLAGTAGVLGHIYPFFLDFRGGKGVACYVGMLLAVDWQIGAGAIVILLLLTIITDYVAMGSILLYILIPFLAYYRGNYSTLVISCILVLLIIGMIKHWLNIQRIWNGTETGFRSVIYKNKKN